MSASSRRLVLALTGASLLLGTAGCGSSAEALVGAERPWSTTPEPVAFKVVKADAADASVSVQPTGRDRACVSYQPYAIETGNRVVVTVVKDERGCAGDRSKDKTPPVLPIKLEAALNGRAVFGAED